ncbi:hypothetical protein J7E62_27560 [Variovorax paradoxus]|nr:hypothetical protein [Variovorax paradoxus]
MTTADSILACFDGDVELTSELICKRTGFDVSRVATYMARLRDRGIVERVGAVNSRPAVHRLSGAARERELARLEHLKSLPIELSETLVGTARRTQPSSVFHLARFS